MKTRMASYMKWLLLYPLFVGYTDPSPSKKGIVDLVLGFGNFMNINYSGCAEEGSKTVISNSFIDFGVDIRTKGEILHGVVKGGYVSNTSNGTLYRYTSRSNSSEKLPEVSSSSGYVGLGIEVDESWIGFTLGAMYFTDKIQSMSSSIQPIVNVRFGRKNKFNASFGYLNNPTPISYGGPVDIMISFPVNSDGSSTLGLGIGGGIYQGLQMKTRLVITPSGSRTGILLNGNYGSVEGHSEYGISVGLRFTY